MAYLEAVRGNLGRLRHMFLTVCLFAAPLLLSSCVEEGDGFPDIVSMTVSPSTISQTQTAGMTDQFFDIRIAVADFEGAITDADAFIQLQSGDIEATKESFEIEGNTIVLTGVRYTWFTGLEPGNYDIGATVVSDAGERVQELDLTTVEVTPR